MLEVSISILLVLAAEWALLHHIDERWFEFETAIFDVCLRSSSDIATGWSQKVINALPHEPSVQVLVAVAIPETFQQYLGHAILKILLKKTLIEISLSRILDPNGNWPVGQIRSYTSLQRPNTNTGKQINLQE
jgi:hypothetical protein